jgi:hypothetical protein
VKYKGYSIEPWKGPYGETPDKGEPKYFVQIYDRATGLPMGAEFCPRAWSLREAKETINETLRYAS